MKTPREWDEWCDEVHKARGEYPTWHELITAVQQDARATLLGSSLSTTLAELLLGGKTEPDFGPHNER